MAVPAQRKMRSEAGLAPVSSTADDRSIRNGVDAIVKVTPSCSTILAARALSQLSMRMTRDFR